MKIKVPFCVATEDLKGVERKILPVEVHIPENLENEVQGNIEYSVRIPEHMFNELADTEPQFKTDGSVYNTGISGCWSRKTLTRKFCKTQTAVLIDTLQDYMIQLTSIINARHSIEASTMKKKIFIFFHHDMSHTRNGLNAAYMGQVVSQKFQYFTGYEVMTDKFSFSALHGKEVKKNYISKIEYHSEGSSLRKRDTNFQERDDLFLTLLGLNERIENFEEKFSIIDWTEEREEFCKRIQKTFTKVNFELSEFLKDISNEKMDALMSGNGLKFLNA